MAVPTSDGSTPRVVIVKDGWQPYFYITVIEKNVYLLEYVICAKFKLSRSDSFAIKKCQIKRYFQLKISKSPLELNFIFRFAKYVES